VLKKISTKHQEMTSKRRLKYGELRKTYKSSPLSNRKRIWQNQNKIYDKQRLLDDEEINYENKQIKQLSKAEPQLIFAKNDINIDLSKSNADRGIFYNTVATITNTVGKVTEYIIDQLIYYIHKLVEQTQRIGPLNSLFAIIEAILTSGKWIGKFGFQILFSVHPNIIAPILSTTISTALGYVCGSYIGGMLWPNIPILNKLFSIMTASLNFSVFGIGSAAVAFPVGTYFLTQPIGYLADKLMLIRPTTAAIPFLLKSIARATIGAATLYGVATQMLPSKIIEFASSFSPFLLESLTPLTFLKDTLPYILYSFVSSFNTSNVINKVANFGICSLFFSQIFQFLFKTAEVVKVGAEMDVLKKELDVVGAQIEVVSYEVLSNQVNQLKDFVDKTPTPQTTEWTGIMQYLMMLVNGFTYYVFGKAGLICAFLCASLVVVWFVYSKWEDVFRIDYDEEAEKIEAIQCVSTFIQIMVIFKDIVRERANGKGGSTILTEIILPNQPDLVNFWEGKSTLKECEMIFKNLAGMKFILLYQDLTSEKVLENLEVLNVYSFGKTNELLLKLDNETAIQFHDSMKSVNESFKSSLDAFKIKSKIETTSETKLVEAIASVVETQEERVNEGAGVIFKEFEVPTFQEQENAQMSETKNEEKEEKVETQEENVAKKKEDYGSLFFLTQNQ
jgi:hypothetical protein